MLFFVTKVKLCKKFPKTIVDICSTKRIFGIFFPRSSDYNDELVYAAAMLYKATGDQAYLAAAESLYDEFNMDYKTSWAFDWSDKMMGAKVMFYQNRIRSRGFKSKTKIN